VEVSGTTLADDELEKCLVKAFKRWTFPKPKGTRKVSVEYPLLFGAD
jgi:hypothetical protein